MEKVKKIHQIIQTNPRLLLVECVVRRGGDVMNDIVNIIANITLLIHYQYTLSVLSIQFIFS
jgi:hypothetical protein